MFCPRQTETIQFDSQCVYQRHHAKVVNEVSMKFYFMLDLKVCRTVWHSRQLKVHARFYNEKRKLFFYQAAMLLANASLKICKRYDDSFTRNMNCHYNQLPFRRLPPFAAAGKISGKRVVKDRKRRRKRASSSWMTVKNFFTRRPDYICVLFLLVMLEEVLRIWTRAHTKCVHIIANIILQNLLKSG